MSTEALILAMACPTPIWRSCFEEIILVKKVEEGRRHRNDKTRNKGTTKKATIPEIPSQQASARGPFAGPGNS